MSIHDSRPRQFRVNTQNIKFPVLTQNYAVLRLPIVMATKKRVGRPPKEKKEINLVRQVGRWTDEDWELIRRAARKADKSVAAWARERLLRSARRELS